MASFTASGFKNLSVSEDGMVVSFTFAQREGEDVEISMPGAALTIVLPYLAEAEGEARRRRETAVFEEGSAREPSD